MGWNPAGPLWIWSERLAIVGRWNLGQMGTESPADEVPGVACLGEEGCLAFDCGRQANPCSESVKFVRKRRSAEVSR